MKSLFVILFAIPLLGQAQSVDNSHELLWEISGNGIKTSYLFGSMHTNDRRVYNLSDSTYFAMDEAEVISCEVDVFKAFEDKNPLVESVEIKYDSNGEPYTSSRESSKSVYGDEDGMPQPLDGYFQQFSYNAGKKFVPLESVDFQVNLFSEVEFKPNWKKFNFDVIFRGEDELLNLYLTGDIHRIDEFMQRSLDAYTDLYDVIIVDRNVGMANKLDSLMQSNKVFCAVGAGHLAGGSGVINLLRGKGYSVRKVTASYSDESTPAEQNVKSFRNYAYENDSIGFRAIFHGKPLVVNDEFDKEGLIHLAYRDLGQGNTYEIEVYNRTDELSLKDLAEIYIPSPEQSPIEKITLENGGEAYQGIGQSYWDGVHWVRVVSSEEIFIVIKAYGGNKFMNSPRAFRFFDQVWID